MTFLQISSPVDLGPLESAVSCELAHFRAGLFATGPGHLGHS